VSWTRATQMCEARIHMCGIIHSGIHMCGIIQMGEAVTPAALDTLHGATQHALQAHACVCVPQHGRQAHARSVHGLLPGPTPAGSAHTTPHTTVLPLLLAIAGHSAYASMIRRTRGTSEATHAALGCCWASSYAACA
jgi:hypothetical protein